MILKLPNLCARYLWCMDFYPFEFTGPIATLDFGRMAYWVVYLPDNLVTTLDTPSNPRLRIRGDIDGYDIEAAIMPSRDGYYVMCSKSVQKRIGKAPGDTVTIRFGLTDPDAVQVPKELQAALDEDAYAKSIWDQMTAGKRRGHAYRGNSAQTPPTRHKRVAEVMGMVLDT